MTADWEVPVAVGVAGFLFVYVLWFFWHNLKLKVLYYSLFMNGVIRRGVETFKNRVAGKKGDSKIEAILSDDFLSKQNVLILELIEDAYDKKLEREVKKNGKRGQNSGVIGEEERRGGSVAVGSVGGGDAQRGSVQDRAVEVLGKDDIGSGGAVEGDEGKK